MKVDLRDHLGGKPTNLVLSAILFHLAEEPAELKWERLKNQLPAPTPTLTPATPISTDSLFGWGMLGNYMVDLTFRI